MKNRMSIIFFGVCLLAALLGEEYCIQNLNGDLFSTLGIGLVVLIMGYLFLDSIRSNIRQRRDKAQFYLDRFVKEMTEKWSERYTELTNIQKATYSVTKKNTQEISKQFEDILLRLEDMENNNMNMLQILLELQKKSMEGQKNALNMQIHYGKENTKQLITAIRAEENKNDGSKQRSDILYLLKENNELLKNALDRIDNCNRYKYSNEDIKMNAPEPMTSRQEELESEADPPSENELEIHAEIPQPEDGSNLLAQEAADQTEENIKSEGVFVKPLYDDPNKNLSAEEIAALFASAGK
jgi:hypothetical protein